MPKALQHLFGLKMSEESQRNIFMEKQPRSKIILVQRVMKIQIWSYKALKNNKDNGVIIYK